VGFVLRSEGVAPDGDWILENVRNPTEQTYRSKVGDRFVQALLLDIQGSGVSTERQHVPRYELYFRHAVTGAALTFRAHAQSNWAKRLALDVFAMERVDAESSTLSTVVADGSGVAVVNESDSRVAEFRGGAPVVVQGLPAYAFEYLVRDANQMRLELPEQPIRVRTVFVRADFFWELDFGDRPVVLEFTLAARDVYFASLEGALTDLLARFRRRPRALVPAEVRDRVDRCFPAGQQRDSIEVRMAYLGYPDVPRPAAFAIDGREISDPTLVACLREALRDQHTARPSLVLYLREKPSRADGREYSADIWKALTPQFGAVPSSLEPRPTE
jgi:hypothetical protein